MNGTERELLLLLAELKVRQLAMQSMSAGEADSYRHEINRLRRDEHGGSVVKVRIRVAVWPDGDWCAYGSRRLRMVEAHEIMMEEYPPGHSVHWFVADVPLPVDVEGTIAE